MHFNALIFLSSRFLSLSLDVILIKFEQRNRIFVKRNQRFQSFCVPCTSDVECYQQSFFFFSRLKYISNEGSVVNEFDLYHRMQRKKLLAIPQYKRIIITFYYYTKGGRDLIRQIGRKYIKS